MRTDIDRVIDARASIRRKLDGLYATFRCDVAAAAHMEGRERLLRRIEGAEKAIERLDALLAQLVEKGKRP